MPTWSVEYANVCISLRCVSDNINCIYVIAHSLLEVSFCTQPFLTPSGGLWSLWFLTLVIYMFREGNGR